MVKIENLLKKYESNFQLNIEKVNFPDKGLIFILGKSGSGKSTLIKLISGLEKYDEGFISIGNFLYENKSEEDLALFRKDNIGLVFQEHNLLYKFNCYDNISFLAENKKEIDNNLKLVDMADFRKIKVNKLSGGEQQRVAIARVLSKKYKLLLADEPTGSLDEENSRKIFEIFKKISKEKLVIVVSHDHDLAKEYGDFFVELKNGKVVKNTIINKNNITNENIIFEKGKMDFLNLFKISYLYLKYNFLKYFLYHLFVLISLFIFISIFSFSFFDKSKYLLKTNIDEGFNEVYIKKRAFNKNDALESEDFLMNENDFLEIKKYTNKNVLPIMNYVKGSFSDLIDEDLLNKEQQNIFNFDIKGAIEFSNIISENFNYRIIHGRAPNKNSYDNEIMISEFLYRLILKFGYNDSRKIEELFEKEFDVIIKEEMKKVKIVGIVDTLFNYKKFKNIFDNNIPFNIKTLFMNYVENGLHFSIFLRENYSIDYKIERKSSKVVLPLYKSDKKVFSIDYHEFNNENVKVYYVDEYYPANYYSNNYIKENIKRFEMKIENYYWIGLLILFSTLLISILFTLYFSINRSNLSAKDYGIFLTLGISKKNIFKVILYEIGLLFLFQLLIGYLLTTIIINKINYEIVKNFESNMKILSNFNFYVIFGFIFGLYFVFFLIQLLKLKSIDIKKMPYYTNY